MQIKLRLSLLCLNLIFLLSGGVACAAPLTISKNYQLRDSGSDILNLQKFLNSDGFVIAKSGPGSPGQETSYFGALTYKALVKFQASAGLPATGYLGPLTRAKIATTVSAPVSSAGLPAPTASSSASVATASSSSLCTAPAGFTCVPGTSIVQPNSPYVGYTPGYGGGGPSTVSVAPAATPDTTVPTISLTNPLNGSTVSGSVTLSAAASDNIAVAGVKFYVNGILNGSEDTSSPYSISWDSTATSSGSKTIVAVARDTSNNYATSSAITVTDDNTPPVISAVASSTTSTTATITWTTDEAANSQINFGASITYGNASSSATRSTSHSITLSGLTDDSFYHFQIQSVDSQGNTVTSSDQTFATQVDGNTQFHRAYNVLIIPGSVTYYSFPARVRPNEPLRTQLIIRNLGTTTIEFAYRSSGDNAQFTPDSSYSISLNPGQEYAENGASTRMIFVRPHTSGQSGRYSVYVELNGATQNGIAVTRAITPVPVGIPVFNVLSYTTSTAQPIGISQDRATVYGASGTTLYQSVNDGASWSSIATFSDNIVGLVETDDGEAICITQGGAAAPGKLYKSTGWSTSHTSATWSLKLTSASAGYFRNYWDAGSYVSFGRNSINGRGKYGVTAEYGPLLSSGTDPTYPTHAYFTSDYGATWTQVLDIQTYPPSGYPMHIKAAAYDPYFDRLWATYDQVTPVGVNAAILYSDDHGVSWKQLPLPPEWQGVGDAFQSNPIGILKDRIIFGSDHTDGYYVFPRTGYRTLGAGYISAITAGHTGAQQTNLAMYRGSPTSQFFATISGISGSLIVPSLIFADAIDDGKTLTELWRDESQIGNGNGLADIYGPTVNGVVLGNFVSGAKVLRGTIVQGVQGQYDQTVPITGDGSTKVFTFPHFLSVTPTTLLAYPQNAASVAASVPTLAADGTNITLTFGTAPSNGAALSYALRYQ